MSKLENQNPNEFNKVRPVDELAKDVESWWERSFIYVGKNEIKAWKAYAIVAFFGGLAAATIFMVSFNLQLKSNAEANASILTLFPEMIEVNQGETFDVDVALNTKENNIVAVKAVIDYDTQRFSLESWDTSNSTFSLDNTCTYQGKPCEIVDNNTSNGKITITLAKPSPGVNTSSGFLAKLTFKALQAYSVSEDGIVISFSGAGSYSDSDAIQDDGSGTDILSAVTTSQITILGPVCTSIAYTDWGACQSDGTQIRSVDTANSLPSGCEPVNPELTGTCTYVPPTCTSFSYSDWGDCQSNNTRNRTVTEYLPVGCTGGGNPITEESCIYTAPICTSFTYSNWGDCQPNGTRSRTVDLNSPSGCSGGDPIIEESCTYSGGGGEPTTCTSFTYSSWGECQLDNTQSRTVVSSSPSGCSGGNPVLQESCTYTAPTCTSFTYSNWGDCQSNNTRSRVVFSSSPSGCTGGNPVTEESCTYIPPTCTSFTYSSWSACQSNNTQSRTVESSSPSGCTGGNPVTEESCTYAAPTCTSFTYSSWSRCSNHLKTRSIVSSSPIGCVGGNPILKRSCDSGSKSKNQSADSAFRITDLPKLLSKSRGDKIWWNTAGGSASYYTYSFVGQKVKTKNNSFNISLSSPRGLHVLKVTAYNKAGKSTSKTSIIRVK